MRPDFTDIRQRIIHCGELRLLSRAEARDYISHRLNLVGCSTPVFDDSASEAIYEMSAGNMRAIDNLAYKALCEAARAKKGTVGTDHVTKAGAQLWT